MRWENRRFNRVETVIEHRYIKKLGYTRIGTSAFEGYIKCKLVHAAGYSLVIPDLLFLGVDGRSWLQPLGFGPTILRSFDDHVECRFNVDFSCGNRLIVSFGDGDFVMRFSDGSELFRCKMQGRSDLIEFASGDSVFQADKAPRIKLYHHTTPDAKTKILASQELWLSPWNIQGTKKLVNVGYVYFTALDQVTHDEDLTCVAMSSNGRLEFWVDQFEPPNNMSKKEILERYSIYILRLPVYRASTCDRTASLEFSIECSCLAPQHIWRHTTRQEIWYEVCNPFTHRIGLPPGDTLKFGAAEITDGGFPLKRFEYIVVGDATKLSGLAAPYNEEGTDGIWKIERPPDNSNILKFWFEAGNQDLFTGKSVEPQQFTSA